MKKLQKSSTGVVFLRGKKVILRPPDKKDIPLLAKWINDPEIRCFINNFLPTTEGAERVWLEGLDKKPPTDIVLIIEVAGKAIGSMGLHRINMKDRVATTGAIIGEKEYWGKGYGTDAKMILLDYAFNTLNLRKVMSSVKAFNRRSLSYSLHCGYCVEGRLRRQHFVDGKYYDEIMLGVFRHEWLPYWQKYCAK